MVDYLILLLILVLISDPDVLNDTELLGLTTVIVAS